jgi:hypothetical protein
MKYKEEQVVMPVFNDDYFDIIYGRVPLINLTTQQSTKGTPMYDFRIKHKEGHFELTVYTRQGANGVLVIKSKQTFTDWDKLVAHLTLNKYI